jgi:type IV pilus assembly protein PilE
MLRQRGFSLVELMVALGVVSVLAGLAYPSFAQVLRKARRGDAVMALMEVQQAQERWRASSPHYGSLEQIGIAATAANGAYQLSILAHDALGYVASAEAIGMQASDAGCRFLELTLSGGQTMQASGADADVRNGEAANRRCWNR